ncbi:MAG TPA: EamA family transporter [Casimicrobiaceae bacterium]|jgi:drug/metabolite transporter (DMT)-like permease
MRLGKGILSALAAAALFGASTPIAKTLVGEVQPVLLAGLLYAGSGLGLAVALVIRRVWRGGGSAEAFAWPRGRELAWLAGAILFGGVLGPVLLMRGLASTAASVSSMLLNFEAGFTALLAWFVFRENFDRRIALGLALIVAGGLVLSWTPGEVGVSPGALLIAAACLCWAIDNNLTRKASASDAMAIACAKGLIAGVVNIGIGTLMGAAMPPPSTVSVAAMVGLGGYGISLALVVRALRELGSARTGAYFAVAPFFGAVLAILLYGEPVSWQLSIAGALMAAGVWLHMSERHGHLHAHERRAHTHAHSHDEHHRHGHDFAWDGREPHTHAHVHAPMVHAHPHYPDLHHRHPH